MESYITVLFLVSSSCTNIHAVWPVRRVLSERCRADDCISNWSKVSWAESPHKKLLIQHISTSCRQLIIMLGV